MRNKKIRSARLFFSAIFLIPFILPSCASTPAPRPLYTSSGESIETLQAKIVEGAELYVKTQNIPTGKRKFAKDCSGVVSAIYYYAGIDLQKYYSSYSGSGTERIYKTLKARNLLKKTWLPAIGDIVFWDNTYDRNKNGKADDNLTHLGIVVSIDKKGNIVYAHDHYREGVIFENMNLRLKDTYTTDSGSNSVVINSPMRMRNSSTGDHNWLASQLFHIFGEGYYLE